jgi:hypothetical protein
MVVHELQVRVDMVDNDEIMVDNDPHRPDWMVETVVIERVE